MFMGFLGIHSIDERHRGMARNRPESSHENSSKKPDAEPVNPYFS
jgi:hypothetical protein